MILAGGLIVAVLALAVLNREWLAEALSKLQNANPWWLLAAFGTILGGYFITAQVLNVAARSMGYRLGMLRAWAIAIVAIVLSQSVPAGGVGSYAFLVGIVNRRGVPSGKAALIASLETLSYVTAMLIIFLGSMVYLLVQGLATGGASYIAAVVALVVISTALYMLTRSEARLIGWFVPIQQSIARLLRRSWGDEWVRHTVGELVRGRRLLVQEWRSVIWLVPLQLVGLLSHSLAMLMVLYSLGVTTSFFVVVIAFGVALITSTFNILPGGGGTVEAALVAVLAQLGVGPAAVPAAIIFRLLNFWLLLPIAAGLYYWLMHEPAIPTPTDDVPGNGATHAPNQHAPVADVTDAGERDTAVAHATTHDHDIMHR